MQDPRQRIISLRGSSTTIMEYLKFAINAILFHRGVYPTEDFYMEKRYGLDLLLTINPDVEIYIEKILDRVDDWLVEGVIKNIVIVIMSQDSGEVIERWVFDTHMNEPIPQPPPPTDEAELRAVIKPIISSSNFLPSIEEPTVFNILVHTVDDDSLKLPNGWETTVPAGVDESRRDQIPMKTLDTKVHKIGLNVAYRE